MKTYYFTFGQKYRRERHPRGGHPDGWFAVEAATVGRAVEIMHALCGDKWSMVYSNEPSKETYPKGELKRI